MAKVTFVFRAFPLSLQENVEILCWLCYDRLPPATVRVPDQVTLVCDTDTVSQNKAQDQSVNWVLTASNMSVNWVLTASNMSVN